MRSSFVIERLKEVNGSFEPNKSEKYASRLGTPFATLRADAFPAPSVPPCGANRLLWTTSDFYSRSNADVLRQDLNQSRVIRHGLRYMTSLAFAACAPTANRDQVAADLSPTAEDMYRTCQVSMRRETAHDAEVSRR